MHREREKEKCGKGNKKIAQTNKQQTSNNKQTNKQSNNRQNKSKERKKNSIKILNE